MIYFCWFKKGNKNESDASTLLKLHFGCFFKCLIEFTVESLKWTESLEQISRLVSIHSSLVLLKPKSNNTLKEINILTVLKNSKLFLNQFLKTTMLKLDKLFDTDRALVVQVLDELQTSVHYLKEVCQSKANTSLTRQTPVYMRSVEAFAVRVKQLLTVNLCDKAFVMRFTDAKFDVKKATIKKKKKKVAAAEEEGRFFY